MNPWTGKPGTIEPDTYNGTNYYSVPTSTYSYPTYTTTTSTYPNNNSNSTVSSEIKYHDRYSLEERKAIEQFLSDLGLNTGLVDGIFTQTTINAIEVLQMSIGVEIDGKFGDETFNRLIEISEED